MSKLLWMTNCKECERERPWPILEVLFQRLPLWVTSRYDIIQHSCSSANIPQETLWIEIRYDNDWYSVSFCTHVIAVCSDFIRHKILLINFCSPWNKSREKLLSSRKKIKSSLPWLQLYTFKIQAFLFPILKFTLTKASCSLF